MKKTILIMVMLTFTLFIGCSKQKEKEYVRVGENWEAFNKISDGKGIKAVLSVGKETYKTGEEIGLSVSSDKDGRVWLITIGPNDKPALIFPNEIVGDNKITANKTLRLPPEKSQWLMKAVEPAGVNLIIALVTKTDVAVEDIKKIMESKDKATAIEQALSEWGSAKKVIKVAKEGEK